MRRFLEQQPHVKVWKDYATLLEQAVNGSAIVHHGVQDVAQRCISLGRPQLLFPWTQEQKIFDASTRWMAFSWQKEQAVPVQEIADTLRGLLRDTSLVVAAQHHARQLANTNLPDALPGIIERIEAAAPAAGRSV